MRKEIAGILRESSHAIYKVGVRDRTSSIARNRDYLKSVDQIKGFNANDKQTIRELLARNFEDGKGMRGSARDIQQAFPDMKRERAEMIARTGHTEINNLAQHEKYLEKGFQSFTIDSTAEACDECNETYQGIVFPMDAVEMLPPLHPHCMCVAIYHEETAEEYAAANGLEVYEGGEETPEIVYHEDERLQEVMDVVDFIQNIPDEQLTSLLETITPDVLGTATTDELVVSDIMSSMSSYIEEPAVFSEKEPLKAQMMLEFLRKLRSYITLT